MSLSTKILIWLGCVATLGMLAFIIYKQLEISKRQQSIESEVVLQKNLVDGIVRGQSQYSTKEDIKDYISKNDINYKAIQSDLDRVKGDIIGVVTVSFGTKERSGTNQASTGNGKINTNPIPENTCKDGTPCPNIDKYGYFKKEKLFDVIENYGGNDIKTGLVGFSAWQEQPWSFKMFAKDYKLFSVVGTDENQRNYYYHKLNMTINGATYTLPIQTAESKQEYPEAKWSWWNPKLHLTAGISANLTSSPIEGSFNAGMTFSPFSYGRYKTSPDMTLLQVGAVYQANTRNLSFITNPINFNIGKVVPGNMVSNTYVGPSLQISTNGNFFVGVNLSVGL